MKSCERRVLYQNLYAEGIALMGPWTLYFPMSGEDAKKNCERCQDPLRLRTSPLWQKQIINNQFAASALQSKP